MDNLFHSQVDPFFERGAWRGIDPRYLLLNEEDFWNRYSYDMSSYGVWDGKWTQHILYWKDWENIPKCSTCWDGINDSSQLRKFYGPCYCLVCIKDAVRNNLSPKDKRRKLDIELVFFYRVAWILDELNTQKTMQVIELCHNMVRNVV